MMVGSNGKLAIGAGAAIAVSGLLLLRKKLQSPKVVIDRADWLNQYERILQGNTYETDEEMVAVAVEIASINVAKNTGGPFGCAIFEKDLVTGKATLFAVGANRVVELSNCTLHAEMTAIQFAQRKIRSYTLHQVTPNKEYILCTSCEPCAMCLGGCLWSGVSEIICSATKHDAEAIGFNEGPVFPESYAALEAAGVRVKFKVLHPQGAQVLEEYGKCGEIYNR